ncbi:hypothetical protein H0H93_001532 [Arthromyces matolae]|nr:hypothetical protein H0H93_001532 [Arthromyces matolae]
MSLLYVVLGGDKPGLSQTPSFVSGGKKGPAFPVNVKCETEEQALEISQLQHLVMTAIQDELSPEDLMARMRSSKLLFNTLRSFRSPFYALLGGKAIGIYLSQLEAQEQEALVKPPIRHTLSFKTFRGAFLYMISRGMDTTGDRAGIHLTDSFDSLNATPPHNEAADPSESSPNETMPQSTPFRHRSKPMQNARNPTPKSPTPKSRGEVPPEIQEELRAAFGRFGLDSTRSEANFIHQHVRDFTGIISTHSTPLRPRFTAPPPSLGEIMDDYLEAHGYNDTTRRLLFSHFVNFIHDKNQFSYALCQEAKRDVKLIRYTTTTRRIFAPSRKPWRVKSRTKPKPQNPEDKARKKAQRQERNTKYNERLDQILNGLHEEATALHEDFGGHSVEYYLHEILQKARAIQSTRAPSRWNAYVRAETARINSATPDSERKKANELSKDIAATWNTLSKEDQIKVTEPLLEDLKNHRSMKKFSVQNSVLSSFRDATKTLETIEHDLQALHHRTGTECILIAVRSSIDAFLKPFVVSTSQRGEDWYFMAHQRHLHEGSLQFEGYCTAGLDGVIKKGANDVAELKKEATKVIKEQLGRVAHGKPIRMVYTNFDEKVTYAHGILLENWPLKTFSSPSDMSTRHEITVLLDSFKSGVTRFRAMGGQEWMKWKETYDTASDQGNVSEQANIHENSDSSTPSPTDQNTSSESTESSSNPTGPVVPSSGSPDEDMPGDEDSLPPPPTPRVPLAATTNINSDSTTPAADDSASTAKVRGKKRKADNFINSTGVTTASGETLIVTKKARKERSDKGKTRGQRTKSKPTQNSENVA